MEGWCLTVLAVSLLAAAVLIAGRASDNDEPGQTEPSAEPRAPGGA